MKSKKGAGRRRRREEEGKDEKETTTMEDGKRRRGKKKRRRWGGRRKRNEIRFVFGGFGHSLRRAVSQLWQIDRGCLVRYVITLQSTDSLFLKNIQWNLAKENKRASALLFLGCIISKHGWTTEHAKVTGTFQDQPHCSWKDRHNPKITRFH